MRSQKIDREWLRLIIEAKQLGLSIDDVRRFFEESNKKGKFTGQ